MNAIIRTASGDLEGVRGADASIHVFKGIPYAQPPVSALRWRAPRPAQKWSGVRRADHFGPRSIQPDRPKTSVSYFGPEDESEDCLTLNVFTPAPERGARRPVMAWIHGGGFAVGSSSLPTFDGEALARRGVVVVTMNYRLGGLGFFAHPELTREDPQFASGNFGLLDIVAALRWVQDNIDAFGGDPGCVTIFGQSVGASCVNTLMAMPMARGLFHRAIGQSGGSMVPAGRPGGGSMLRLDEAEKIGERVAASFGCKSVGEMRALPAKDVNLRWPKDAMARPFMVIDGAVIPEPVPEAFAHGRQARVPLISGANSDEHSARGPAASLDAWKRELQSEFGSHWERLFQAYGGEENFTRASRRLPTQKGFNWCNWIWASDHAATSGAPTFAYHFSHAPPLPEGATFAEAGTGPLGAFHTAEIPYVFGTLRNRPWPWRDEDFALSQIMSSYWLNFATTGDPNGPGLPRWPTLDPRAPTTMLFDGAAPRAGAQPDRALLDLWDETFARAGDARCAR